MARVIEIKIGCGRTVWGNTVEEAVSAWNEGAKTDDET